MKRTRILPFLLLLPLLSGCKDEFKEPKFKKLGDKIEYSAFKEALDNLYKENVFLKSEENYYRPSYKGESVKETYKTSTQKRLKDTLYEGKSYSKTTINLQGDAKNLVSKRVQEHKATSEEHDSTCSSTSASTSKATYYDQPYSQFGSNYFVTACLESETFLFDLEENKETENRSMKDMYEAGFSAATATMSSLFTTYMTMYNASTDEKKAEFSFYKNKDVISTEYNHTDVNEKDGYAIENNENTKFQIDLSNKDKIEFTYYKEVKTKETIKQSKGSDIAGDVTETTNKSLATVNIQKKNVNLKSTNVDKFTKYEY